MTSPDRHSAKRRLIAWLLMVVFTLPLIVKTLHVCQVNADSRSGVSAMAGHHGDGHDEADCAICHFAFFTFTGAEHVVLAVIAVPVLFVFLRRPDEQCSHRCSRVLSLRAPPYFMEG